MKTFLEWMNGSKRPPSIKNKDIDAFLSAVDNLKRDMDELDVLEKKPKKKPTDSKKKPPEDAPKKSNDERPEPDREDGEDAEDDVVDAPLDIYSDRQSLRFPPDRKVQRVAAPMRKEPDSQKNSQR